VLHGRNHARALGTKPTGWGTAIFSSDRIDAYPGASFSAEQVFGVEIVPERAPGWLEPMAQV